VFNALDILENAPFLEDLKFGIGDGQVSQGGVLFFFFSFRARGLATSLLLLLFVSRTPAHPHTHTKSQLRYYLYNWRVPAELKPGQVGLVML
jgi:hypothetical protein